VPFDCINYKSGCGNCPQLNSGRLDDLSRRTLEKKKKNWKNLNLNIVTPSNWMAKCVKESELFRDRTVTVIYPGIDTNIFRPRDKVSIKKELNLNVEKRYIIFGAIKATEDLNKGFHLLKEALLILKNNMAHANDLEIIVLGASEPEESIDLGFKCNYVGKITDEITIALYYSVGDVFVLPSLKDNSPNTVIESMGCGIPVVAFAACGALDMVDHKMNGYLATPYDVNDFSRGLDWIINKLNPIEYDEISKNARLKVLKDFNIDNVADQYALLYENVLKS
jgi:glycosyltransferase involved in cell wall biosynthesis